MGAAIPSERTQKSITRKFRSSYFFGLIFRIVVNIRVYSHAVLSDSRCTQWLTLRSIEFRAALWKPRCTVFVFPFLKEKNESDFKNGVKATVNGLWSKWKVHGGSTGRPCIKLDGLRKLNALKSESGRSKKQKLVDLKRWNWTIQTEETGRSQLWTPKELLWAPEKKKTG